MKRFFFILYLLYCELHFLRRPLLLLLLLLVPILLFRLDVFSFSYLNLWFSLNLDRKLVLNVKKKIKIMYKQIDVLHTECKSECACAHAPNSVPIAQWTRLKCLCRSELFYAIWFLSLLRCYTHYLFQFRIFKLFFSLSYIGLRVLHPLKLQRKRRKLERTNNNKCVCIKTRPTF